MTGFYSLPPSAQLDPIERNAPRLCVATPWRAGLTAKVHAAVNMLHVGDDRPGLCQQPRCRCLLAHRDPILGFHCAHPHSRQGTTSVSGI